MTESRAPLVPAVSNTIIAWRPSPHDLAPWHHGRPACQASTAMASTHCGHLSDILMAEIASQEPPQLGRRGVVFLQHILLQSQTVRESPVKNYVWVIISKEFDYFQF